MGPRAWPALCPAGPRAQEATERAQRGARVGLCCGAARDGEGRGARESWPSAPETPTVGVLRTSLAPCHQSLYLNDLEARVPGSRGPLWHFWLSVQSARQDLTNGQEEAFCGLARGRGAVWHVG